MRSQLVLLLPFATILLIFPLSSASTSAGLVSLVGGVTPTFTPEGSGPLVVPPELGCCSFALTAITRYALRDLLYPKRSLPCLHGGAGVHFLLESQDSSPASLVAPFFACWFRGMKSPKGLDSSLNFRDDGIIVVFPCVSIPPFGRMTPGQESRKLCEQQAKFLLVGN